ncbi:MAG TPA: ABC transporter permease [Isosphaeraceae bacterium]|nr:ABC transporter permease [Isosphaeraceae bacterium]
MWQRVWTLVVKELLAALRDPRGRYILIVPPILQMLVFSVAATQEVKNVRMAVLNEDYGTAARDLIARFEGSTNFAKVSYLRGEADIAPAIDSRSVLMVLHLGPDFSRRLEGGMPAEVQLILDGRRSNAAQIVAGYAQAIFDRFERELAATRRTPPPPSVVTARIWFNPNLETTWNTVPALVAILTTLMGLVVTALSVARERELGTFEQLLVSPLDPHEIVIGKTVPALIIGLTEGTFMLLVGIFVFRVPFQGSFVLLYLAMTVFLAAVIGVGLFISSLATTQQQGILGAFVFMVPAILLSGFATPIENMPEWLQTLTLANPLRYYVAIIKGVFLKGMPAATVVQLLWPLAVIALATLSAATWLFRHRVE